MYILFAIVCFAMLVLITCLLALYNYRPVEEQFDFEYQIINMFKSTCSQSTKKDGQLQGVINHKDYIYVVSSKSICQHDKKTGQLIKKVKTNLSHMNGGIIKDNKLYLTHNPRPLNNPNALYLNSIEVFDLNLKHLDSINLSHLYNEGSLTWIDYYDNSWWGALAHYGKQVGKTRLVKFKDNWQIGMSWRYPTNVLNQFKPYSNSGGQFDKETGLLFLTGHDKEEVYIVKVNYKSLRLIPVETMEVPIGGQGISLENKAITSGMGRLHMYGLNRQDGNIYEILIK